MAAGRGRLKPGGSALAAALAVVVTGSAVSWLISSYDEHQRHKTENAAANAAGATLDRRAQAIAQILVGPSAGLSIFSPSEVPAVLTGSVKAGS